MPRNSNFQESLLAADPVWSAANRVMLAIPTASAVVGGAGHHLRLGEALLCHLQQESSSGWLFMTASCEQK